MIFVKSRGASLLQRGLVVVQAALSVLLLVGAGLFMQSLGRLQHMDMKLQSQNRYIIHINAQAAGYKDEQMNALYRTLEQRFHALPGVVNVGVSTYTPMEGNDDGYGIQVLGQPDRHTSATDDPGLEVIVIGTRSRRQCLVESSGCL